MEEKKTFISELEADFRTDEKIRLMEEIMLNIVKLAPVQAMKFVYTATEDPIKRIENAIELLTTDKEVDKEKFVSMLKDLCFSVVTLKQNRRVIGSIYNAMKEDFEEPVDEQPDTKAESNDNDDDDDRTK